MPQPIEVPAFPGPALAASTGLATRVEAGPVPTLADGAILAIDNEAGISVIVVRDRGYPSREDLEERAHPIRRDGRAVSGLVE